MKVCSYRGVKGKINYYVWVSENEDTRERNASIFIFLSDEQMKKIEKRLNNIELRQCWGRYGISVISKEYTYSRRLYEHYGLDMSFNFVLMFSPDIFNAIACDDDLYGLLKLHEQGAEDIVKQVESILC